MKIELPGFPYQIFATDIIPDAQLTRHEREELAVNTLLRDAFGNEARRVHDELGAPLLQIGGKRVDVTITLSHSPHMAALCPAEGKASIGIDIEAERPQLTRVTPRILTPEELDFYSNLPHGLLRAWTLKEALFKACRPLTDEAIDYTNQLGLPLQEGADAEFRDMHGNTLFSLGCFSRLLTAPVTTMLSAVYAKSID